MPETAPVGTVWGSVVSGSNSGRKGKIGISVEVTEKTETNVKFHAEVWFWTIYSCSDGSNTLKFNAGDSVTSASDVVASNKSISHKHDTGTRWSTNNQTKLYEYTSTTGYDRRHTNRTIKFYASFSGIAMLNGTMYASNSVTIVKKASYTVKFNANGGSNAPSSQTKWHGEKLKLSSTKPTRTGYTFLGWGTSSSATSVAYNAGGSYTDDASDTLYAVWKANTYTVAFNANGGSGGPSSQTKTYGQTLTLSSTKRTRTGYNFEGWGLSSNTSTVAYSAGGSYTKNAAATLYAVWTLAYTKPRITNFSIRRLNTDGQLDDQGTICNVIFNWTTDNPVTAITISYRQATSGAKWSDIPLDLPTTDQNKSGSVSQSLSPEFSIENSYEIKVTVSDGDGSSYSSYATRTLPSAKFLIDFKAGGDGIAIGQAAVNPGFEVYMDTNFKKGLFNNGEKVVLESDLATSNITLSVYNDPNSNVPRIRNLNYTAKYVPAIPAVFVRIYGVINDDMDADKDYDIINITSNGPNWRTALSVKSAKHIMAEAKSSVITIRPLEANAKNYDVYIAGFWFV